MCNVCSCSHKKIKVLFLTLCYKKYYKVQSEEIKGLLEWLKCIEHRATTYLFISIQSFQSVWFFVVVARSAPGPVYIACIYFFFKYGHQRQPYCFSIVCSLTLILVY